MKATTLAVVLLSSMALATPLMEKKWILTSVVYETATVTVTESRGWWSWGKPTSSPTLSNTISIVSTTSTPSVTASSSSTSVSIPTVSVVSSSSIATIPTVPIASSSSTSAAASTSSSNSQPTASLSAYARPILEQHNLHRDNHSAPPLIWDYRLANIAQEIASSCQYAHNTKAGGGGYGQNIGAGAPDDQIDKMITNQMYNNEMMFYPGYGNEPDMANFESWGHFSQIVWKSTTSVGCYTQHCDSGLAGVSSNVSPYFTVCNYAGAGNFAGQYADNVLAPRGDAIISL